jgi:hypothetical protein
MGHRRADDMSGSRGREPHGGVGVESLRRTGGRARARPHSRGDHHVWRSHQQRGVLLLRDSRRATGTAGLAASAVLFAKLAVCGRQKPSHSSLAPAPKHRQPARGRIGGGRRSASDRSPDQDCWPVRTGQFVTTRVPQLPLGHGSRGGHQALSGIGHDSMP